jgi:hypothetical protein
MPGQPARPCCAACCHVCRAALYLPSCVCLRRALAAATGGMSGAQIAGVANLACFLASREGRTDVTQVRRGAVGALLG